MQYICYIFKIVFFIFAIIITNTALALTEITVATDKDEIYLSDQDISSISITNKEIVDVDKHSNKKLSVRGKKLGETTITLYNNKDEIIEKLNVFVVQDLTPIKHAIKNIFNDEVIGIEYIDNNIVLTGSASNSSIASKITQLVRKMSNDSSKEIINLINTDSKQQVMLRVRVGEIKKNAIFMLGSIWSIENQDPKSSLYNTKFESTSGIGTSAFDPGLFGYQNALSLAYKTASDIAFKVMLSAMQQEGLFKVLAEPNLVAISGQTAEFRAGNEIAIPVAQSQGINTIEYKQIGVNVKFTPTVLSSNRIRVIVEPEVSEISDYTTSASHKIPNINIRKAHTTVELAPGESFMIAGLIKNEANTKSSAPPYMARVPLLGALFKAASYKEESSELVISITPYIVNPSGNDNIRLPVDNYQFPTPLQSIVMGYAGSYKTSQHPILEGSYGYIMD